MDKYEKLYKEAQERAKKLSIDGYLDAIAVEEIFPPEESEDERIRMALIKLMTVAGERYVMSATGFEKERLLAYLEKQKENPKNAISIPSDCVSDAKCEDRWHKTAHSLPDDGRDVLAKDAIGNYLLASFDGAQWFVSVYDGEDHPVLHTPPILEWCEIPSESQKEQKPAEWSEEDDAFLKVAIAICNRYSHKDIADWLKCLPERFNPQPKQGWNEEDERILKGIIGLVDHDQHYGVGNKEMISWLKSLRPSWKPSEEQMEALERASTNKYLSAKQFDILVSLYEQLKKL